MRRILNLISQLSGPQKVAILGALALWSGITIFFAHDFSDFPQDYFAAYSLRNGLPIYGDHIQRLTLQHTDVGKTVFRVPPVSNNHPPINAVLFYPFTFLPYKVAYTAWNLICLVLYFLTIFLISRKLNFPRKTSMTISIAFCYWFPFLHVIALGQIATLIFILVGLSWIFLLDSKSNAAGVTLGLSVLVKLTPAFLFPILIFNKAWRSLSVAVSTICLGTIATIGVVGMDNFLSFFETIGPNLRDYGPSFLNLSIPGVMLTFLKTDLYAHTIGRFISWSLAFTITQFVAQFVSVLFSLLTVAIAYFLISRKNEGERAFSLMIVAMLMVTPILGSHTLIFLILPFLVLLKSHQDSRLNPLIIAVGISSFLLCCLPNVFISFGLKWYISSRPMPFFVFTLHKIQFLALILLWCVFGGWPKRWFSWNSKG